MMNISKQVFNEQESASILEIDQALDMLKLTQLSIDQLEALNKLFTEDEVTEAVFRWVLLNYRELMKNWPYFIRKWAHRWRRYD